MECTFTDAQLQLDEYQYLQGNLPLREVSLMLTKALRSFFKTT